MHLTHTEVQEFSVTELFQKKAAVQQFLLTSEAGPRIGTCVTTPTLLMSGIWAQNFSLTL